MFLNNTKNCKNSSKGILVKGLRYKFLSFSKWKLFKLNFFLFLLFFFFTLPGFQAISSCARIRKNTFRANGNTSYCLFCINVDVILWHSWMVILNILYEYIMFIYEWKKKRIRKVKYPNQEYHFQSKKSLIFHPFFFLLQCFA